MSFRPSTRRRYEVVEVEVTLIVQIGDDLHPCHGGQLTRVPHGKHPVAARYHLGEQFCVLPFVQLAMQLSNYGKRLLKLCFRPKFYYFHGSSRITAHTCLDGETILEVNLPVNTFLVVRFV